MSLKEEGRTSIAFNEAMTNNSYVGRKLTDEELAKAYSEYDLSDADDVINLVLKIPPKTLQKDITDAQDIIPKDSTSRLLAINMQSEEEEDIMTSSYFNSLYTPDVEKEAFFENYLPPAAVAFFEKQDRQDEKLVKKYNNVITPYQAMEINTTMRRVDGITSNASAKEAAEKQAISDFGELKKGLSGGTYNPVTGFVDGPITTTKNPLLGPAIIDIENANDIIAIEMFNACMGRPLNEANLTKLDEYGLEDVVTLIKSKKEGDYFELTEDARENVEAMLVDEALDNNVNVIAEQEISELNNYFDMEAEKIKESYVLPEINDPKYKTIIESATWALFNPNIPAKHQQIVIDIINAKASESQQKKMEITDQQLNDALYYVGIGDYESAAKVVGSMEKDLEVNEQNREKAIQSLKYQAKQEFKIMAFEIKAKNDPDFEEYAAKGAALENPSAWKGLSILGWKPFAGDIKNKVTFGRENEQIAISAMNVSMPEEDGYTFMTDEEVDIYNYFLAKEGEEYADKYLDSILELLNFRIGTEEAEKIKDKPVLQTIYGIGVGLDRFGSGISQLFSSDALPTTSTQFAGAAIREDLGKDLAKLPEWLGGGSVGQLIYDVCQTAGNLAPSIAVGYLYPPAGAALAGLSAKGNAYNEALKQGYSKGQAEGYSILVGASEGVLQYALGGFAKLGGKLSGKAIGTAIKNIDNAFLRISADLGLKGLSEGVEENLQNVLEQAFRNLAFDENNEIRIFDEETTYNYLLSIITVGLMEGPSTISHTFKLDTVGQSILQAGKAKELIQNALKLDPNTKAYQLASKMKAGKANENAINIGKLLSEYIKAEGNTSFINKPNEAIVKTESITKSLDDTESDKRGKEANVALSDISNATEAQINVLNESITDTIKVIDEYNKDNKDKVDTSKTNTEAASSAYYDGMSNLDTQSYNRAISLTLQSLDTAIRNEQTTTEQRTQLEDAAQRLIRTVDSFNAGISGKVQTPGQLLKTAGKALMALQDLPYRIKQKIGFKASFENYLSAGTKTWNTDTNIDTPQDARANMELLMQVSQSVDAALASDKLSQQQVTQLQAVKAEFADVVGTVNDQSLREQFQLGRNSKLIPQRVGFATYKNVAEYIATKAPDMVALYGNDVNAAVGAVLEQMAETNVSVEDAVAELLMNDGVVSDRGDENNPNVTENLLHRTKSDSKPIEPMPEKQLQKIIDGFTRSGGIIQMDEATDRYLSSKMAEGITYNENTILLKRESGRACIYEELIHATQYRNGEIDGSIISRLKAEIAAQKKLLRNKKAYRLTLPEIVQTESALKNYQKELDELLLRSKEKDV